MLMLTSKRRFCGTAERDEDDDGDAATLRIFHVILASYSFFTGDFFVFLRKHSLFRAYADIQAISLLLRLRRQK
jgi:hypothetical protein